MPTNHNTQIQNKKNQCLLKFAIIRIKNSMSLQILSKHKFRIKHAMYFQFLTHKFKIEHSVYLQILTRKFRIKTMSLQILAHKSSTLVQLLTHRFRILMNIL